MLILIQLNKSTGGNEDITIKVKFCKLRTNKIKHHIILINPYVGQDYL